MFILILIAVFIAFVVSASAGMGGSLILIPVMALTLGSKSGIAVSAILLGCNNIFKVIAYRRTIPLKPILGIMIFIAIGAFLGSIIMVGVSSVWVDWAIIMSFVISFLFERKQWYKIRHLSVSVYAFLAGISSGFSGTSGPLKGVALRNLNLDRFYLVGGASLVSLVGDMVKTTVYFQGALYDTFTYKIVIYSLFIMPFAVYLGKFINEKIGEKAYSVLFWTVMFGYSIRIIVM